MKVQYALTKGYNFLETALATREDQQKQLERTKISKNGGGRFPVVPKKITNFKRNTLNFKRKVVEKQKYGYLEEVEQVKMVNKHNLWT